MYGPLHYFPFFSRKSIFEKKKKLGQCHLWIKWKKCDRNGNFIEWKNGRNLGKMIENWWISCKSTVKSPLLFFSWPIFAKIGRNHLLPLRNWIKSKWKLYGMEKWSKSWTNGRKLANFMLEHSKFAITILFLDQSSPKLVGIIFDHWGIEFNWIGNLIEWKNGRNLGQMVENRRISC